MLPFVRLTVVDGKFSSYLCLFCFPFFFDILVIMDLYVWFCLLQVFISVNVCMF